MRKIIYQSKLILLISEVNRANALKVVQVVNALLDADIDNAGYISNEFHFAYVLNSPVKVLFDGRLLENGIHNLSFDEYDNLSLTLPLTRECFEQLPISLSVAWIEAAEAENVWLSDHFLNTMRMTMPTLFEQESVKPQ